MKLDHTEVVLDFEGEPLKDNSTDTERDMTFRGLVMLALNNMERDERMGSEDKARCYHLCHKFFKGKTIKLTVDEAAFVKQRGGVILSALAFGRLSEWLEGNPQIVASESDEETDEESVD